MVGEQGNEWKKASVTVPVTNVSHRLAIKAFRGDGVRGDIAVDDIRISNDACI